MDLVLIFGLVAAGGLLAWLMVRSSGQDDEAILRRLRNVNGFEVTEAHAFQESGLAADEVNGRLIILGKGRPQMVLIRAIELLGWHYMPRDDVYEMEVRTLRQRAPFLVRFEKRAHADLWIKIFMQMTDKVHEKALLPARKTARR